VASIRFHAAVKEEGDGTLWAQVEELPGCFASGRDIDELREALTEAIQMCLPDGVELGDVVSFERLSETRALVSA
jgi:predicted RNase H-like HicB family nuclease